MFKFILFLCFCTVSTVFAGRRSNAELETKAFTNSDRYCCKIDIPIITTTRYQNTFYTYQQSEVYFTGNQDCGLFGWSNCATYATRYYAATASKVEALVTYSLGTCPTQYETCCNGFAMVGTQCLHIQTELVNGGK